MIFYSTNKQSPAVDFKTALLSGLASDGGLYMPEKFPRAEDFDSAVGNFVDIPIPKLKKIIANAFDFPVPLVKLDKNLYILELFHGPTFSFKDFGARFMARAMSYYLAKSGEKLNIIVATSGDTGSAVANGFYGLPNIKVFILYPSKRISDLQEKQIATLGENITALEVKGDFDDCQRLAKAALADQDLHKKINLSSANSINIGRLLPQMYYYFQAYYQATKQLRNQQLVFVVPSGNFGNLTAGMFAKKIGLPIKKFIAAVNTNSAIPGYLKTGAIKVKKTKMTLSNAMDVGNPSNWARIMDLYRSREAIKKDLEVITIGEAETAETIRVIYKKYGYIADPHTAVGLAAVWKSKIAGPKIVLATAHPAKFKEIVEKTIGKKIKLPKELVNISRKPKQSILIGKEYKELKSLLISQ